MRLTGYFALATAAAATLTISHAKAATLDKNFAGDPPFVDTALPGTTSAARPELAGTVVADVIQIFSVPSQNISGEVQSRVVREDGTGTLDFYWKVTVDRSSTGGNVRAFRLENFGYGDIVDADWRADSLGSISASPGRVFNPVNHPNGAINFLFDGDGVPPGDPASNTNGSHFFFLHTSATSYADTAIYDLLVGPNETISSTFSTFAPVPEPSAGALGLVVAIGAILRRRRK